MICERCGCEFASSGYWRTVATVLERFLFTLPWDGAVTDLLVMCHACQS